MTTANELTQAEKDALLGMDIDDLPELPEFVTPPTGTYVVLLQKAELKKLGDSPAFCLNCGVQSIAELANPNTTEDLPKLNDVMSLAFGMENEYGKGNLRKIATALKASHGAKNLDDVMKLCTAGNIMAALTIKKTEGEKNGEKRYYTNLVSIVIQ